jgi:hypothetical protein
VPAATVANAVDTALTALSAINNTLGSATVTNNSATDTATDLTDITLGGTLTASSESIANFNSYYGASLTGATLSKNAAGKLAITLTGHTGGVSISDSLYFDDVVLSKDGVNRTFSSCSVYMTATIAQ